VEEGHTIGLHTYCHDYNVIYRSVDDFLADYEKLYKRIYEVTGMKPTIFRFPGGSTNRYAKAVVGTIKTEMKRRGFQFYDWNVSAEDMVGTPTRYSIRSNIFKDVFRYDEPVILMHDSAANQLTVSMLKDIIGEIRKSGYDFDTLDHRECCQF
ncbi:MAG: polysaccharide deacetylase family protein, partial [Lachnospiraceae bacterium]|nr:polysaccharide deacetylase family protein [Lachnospiraceae bacterium]